MRTKRDRGRASAKTLAKNSRPLNEFVEMLLKPTPRADAKDNADGSGSGRSAKRRGTYIGRALNPGIRRVVARCPDRVAKLKAIGNSNPPAMYEYFARQIMEHAS